MKFYCPSCAKETETFTDVFMESYPVKGENIEIPVEVRVCGKCREEIWDSSLDAPNLLRAFAEYRRLHRLLQPQEIREIREKYGVSQTVFSRILGFGDKTITRYENGSIQDKAHNNMLLLMRDTKNFELLCASSDGVLTSEESTMLENRITEMLEKAWADFRDVSTVSTEKSTYEPTRRRFTFGEEDPAMGCYDGVA